MKRTIICGLIALCTQTVLAQWSTNLAVNNAICTATGDQRYPAVVSDGSGGAIITWADGRNGVDVDIYAQRISSTGVPQWTPNGVAICTAAGIKANASIVGDGSGGATIAWEDSRNGLDHDIYAQRINSSGVVQWTVNGVPIDTLAQNQQYPTLVNGASGDVIITWEDFRNGADFDIYAQRVNSLGVVQWTSNGVPIDTTVGNQNNPKIASDGSGGAIITWYDFRSGVYYDIYAQRINSAGITQWATNGAPVCTAPNDQFNPVIMSDGSGGAFMTWIDHRNGTDHDIYAQRINSSGAALWTTNGVPICTATGTQTFPVLASDGSGGAIITWYDLRNGIDYDIYAQRISSSGTVRWMANGAPICTATGSQYSPSIAGDGSGGAIITWFDTRNGTDDDIYAQRIDSLGVSQWPLNGAPVCKATLNQDAPAIASDGSGGAIITWEDFRNGINYKVYGLRLDQYGHAYGENPVITLAGDIANDEGGKIRVLWTASTLDVISNSTIQSYTLKMGVKSTGVLGKISSVKGSTTNTVADVPIYWQTVTTIPANWSTGYNAIVTTATDSGPQGTPWYYFQVIATSTVPGEMWPSNVDSGYSVDNLPPAIVSGLVGAFAAGTENLHWNSNTEKDLAGYLVYRSTTSGFNPSLMTPLATTTNTWYVDANAGVGAPMFYAVLAVDIHGNKSAPSSEVSTVTTGVEQTTKLPTVFALHQNYPNPFNPSTEITYDVPATSVVHVTVYDLLGRHIADLVNGERTPGVYQVEWNADKLSSGIYYARMETQGFVATRKLLLMK